MVKFEMASILGGRPLNSVFADDEWPNGEPFLRADETDNVGF